jgi:hypothetical protein
MLDGSEILFSTVHDSFASKSVRRQNILHPASFGISRLWHDISFQIRNWTNYETRQLRSPSYSSYDEQISDQRTMYVETGWMFEALLRSAISAAEEAKVAV